MGPLGGLRLGTVTVDGAPVTATLTARRSPSPSAASCRPARPPRSSCRSARRSGPGPAALLAVHPRQRHREPVPLGAVDQPHDRLRPAEHGDPFVTPVSPRVTLRFRTDVPLAVVVNGTRTSVSADGLRHDLEAANVRDLVVNAAPDYRTRVRDGRRHDHPRLTRPGQPSAAILRAAVNAVTKLEARLGPYPWPVLRIVQSAGGCGMEGPGRRLDPGRRRARRTCATSSPTRSPTSGSTASWATTRRASRSRTRRSRTWSPATSPAPGARPGARRRRSTGRSTATRPPATTSSSTSRAATCSTTPAGGWAPRRSSAPCAATSPTTAGARPHADAARRARCRDAAGPGRVAGGARFPTLY